MKGISLTRFIYLSIAAALITISLKAGAYFLTGSVGLLSDALESIINLVAAIIALFAIRLAQKPADENHAYGHSKAEYFSSSIEGGLIVFAAMSIGYTAINRLMHPQPIEQAWLGIGISILASLVNLAVGIVLLRVGKKYNSITLTADAHHLFTDVWTSAAVIVGIAIVAITKIEVLDPIIALLVAVNIIFTGYQLIKASMLGLLDTAIEPTERKKIHAILQTYVNTQVSYHSLRTRQSGQMKFISFHLSLPGKWSVDKAQKIADAITEEITQVISNSTVFIHTESFTKKCNQ
jgi:cation diffusion facilitator family transporter